MIGGTEVWPSRRSALRGFALRFFGSALSHPHRAIAPAILELADGQTMNVLEFLDLAPEAFVLGPRALERRLQVARFVPRGPHLHRLAGDYGLEPPHFRDERGALSKLERLPVFQLLLQLA